MEQGAAADLMRPQALGTTQGTSASHVAAASDQDIATIIGCRSVSDEALAEMNLPAVSDDDRQKVYVSSFHLLYGSL